MEFIRPTAFMRKTMENGNPRKVTSLVLRYGVAAGLVALATLARLSLDSMLGQEVLPYAFFYLAVAIAAWRAGLGPALMTLVLGLVSGIWLIVPPRHGLAVRGVPELTEILLYLFVTGTVVFLIV